MSRSRSRSRSRRDQSRPPGLGRGLELITCCALYERAWSINYYNTVQPNPTLLFDFSGLSRPLQAGEERRGEWADDSDDRQHDDDAVNSRRRAGDLPVF